MRSRLAITLPVAAATVLLAGGCAAGGGGASTLEEAQADGLVVGTEGTYRPFSFHEGGAGDLTGYDVEVVTAVADRLDIPITFEETQWDALFAALDAGRIDVIANQVSINAEREESYTLSEPYTLSPGVLVVAEDTEDIDGFDDLDGKTSAQSLTSNWYEVATGFGANVEAVEGWAQAVELLVQGRVDATINDRLTYLDYEQTEGGDTGIRVVAETDEVSESAFAFADGNEELAEAFNGALDELHDDGTLAELSERYFGEDVSR